MFRLPFYDRKARILMIFSSRLLLHPLPVDDASASPSPGNTPHTRHTAALLGALLLLLFLHGCSTTTPQDYDVLASAPTPAKTSVPDAASSLEQARLLEANERDTLLLDRAKQYLAQADTASANLMLNALQPMQLSAPKRLAFIILSAQVALADNDPDEALALLTSERLDAPALEANAPLDVQIRMQLLRADALALQGNLLNSIRERVAVAGLLEKEQARHNHQMIWVLANHVSPVELEQALAHSDATESDFNGWLRLAALYRDPLADIDTQSERLDNWLQHHATHPAAQQLPPVLQALQTAAKNRPTKIAVLLPRSGPLASAAAAIENGFLATYFAAIENQRQTPRIEFYDTSRTDIASLYQQAVAAGAELVVGPLDKNNVQTLMSLAHLPVPTLALNYTDSDTHPDNFFQFGLAGEDEAEQVASFSISDEQALAAVLYPDNTWGQRVADAFIKKWQAQGGVVTALEGVPASNDPGQSVKQLLHIGQSEARFYRVRRHIKDKVEFEPRRRQDVDMLFLIANPEQARRIKPALNFHFAHDIPVYSTSYINDGVDNPSQDKDLNGIRFIDAPWILNTQSALQREVTKAWPQGHGRLERLFALGMDSYRLHERLKMLELVPDSSLPGATGQLSIGSNNRIHRTLEWAWFQQGRPVRTPVVAGIKPKKNVNQDQDEPNGKQEVHSPNDKEDRATF